MIADRTPRRKRPSRPWWVAIAIAAALAISPRLAFAQSCLSYPYGSEEFRALVTDSYQVTKVAGARPFPEWFAQAFAEEPSAFPGARADTLDELLDQQRQLLADASGADARAGLEASVAAGFHRLVKNLIPRFSLSRGFEFAYVVKYGERQCLLQSTLLAALLQRVGVDAGIVMVFRNGKRAKSNISHVATLVKLADGTDAIVDASYQQPFVKHTGILVSAPSYRFVQPRYAPHSTRITGYRDERTRWPIAVYKVAPLDYHFVRSQFWFYRGERAPSGILAAHPTDKGLAASRAWLEKSVALCPGNPIAVYLLGRTYQAEGERAQASRLLTRARDLYLSYGWLPEGPAKAAGATDRDRGLVRLRRAVPGPKRAGLPSLPSRPATAQIPRRYLRPLSALLTPKSSVLRAGVQAPPTASRATPTLFTGRSPRRAHIHVIPTKRPPAVTLDSRFSILDSRDPHFPTGSRQA